MCTKTWNVNKVRLNKPFECWFWFHFCLSSYEYRLFIAFYCQLKQISLKLRTNLPNMILEGELLDSSSIISIVSDLDNLVVFALVTI